MAGVSIVAYDNITVATTTIAGECENHEWNPSTHVLFQVAHGVLLLSFAVPADMWVHGQVLMHCSLAVGYVLLAIWAWTDPCSPDIFNWGFIFFVINIIQVFILMYRIRPVKFTPDVETLYVNMFQPVGMTRAEYKKMISAEWCTTTYLRQGELYAQEQISRTSKLTLLLHGLCHVSKAGVLLHKVSDLEFLDSPEYQANCKTADRFRVAIEAVTPCKCITWTRHQLEYLLSKEPRLSVCLAHLLARDVINKLYQMNNKLPPAASGRRIDLRLPALSGVRLSGFELSRFRRRSECIRVNINDSDLDDNQIAETSLIFPNGFSKAPATSPPLL